MPPEKPGLARPNPAMQGKVCVITGATSGIGLVAARRLAAQGARLVLVGRNPAKGAEVVQELRRAVPGAMIGIHYGDFLSLGEVARVAREIAAAEPRIDVLINNAGALFDRRQVTADGLEYTFALNHMAYFVLTEGLRGRLAAGSRIVSTASGAHRRATLDFADLQTARGYSGWRAYQRSKLCNILWTRALARRLAGTGITANCLHPGFVASGFGNNNGLLLRLGLRLAKLVARTPEKGADTIVHLASSPAVAQVTGGYFDDCRLATPSEAAQDDTAARRLWEESEKIAAAHR